MLTGTQVEAAMRCDRGHPSGGGSCAHTGAGHRMSPMRAAASAATPSSWRDALVSQMSPDGWVTLALLDEDTTVRVWNHSDLASELAPGHPVAVHPAFGVLAVGAQRHSVLALP